MAARPTVDEVSAPYANFMRTPAPAGPDICSVCRTFTDGYPTCYRCAHQPDHLDVVVPITYAPSTEQMHTALRKYKDSPDAQVRTRFSRDLLAVFWRFIRWHERCLVEQAGLPAFDIVTTVPSKTTTRDDARGRLRAIVGQHAQPTSERYRRVLRPADSAADERRFDAGRYRAPQRIDGSAVLLVDDTWTTGSSAQSAAAALREAGAEAVALVVIGRYINLDYSDHRQRLEKLPRGFEWDTCAVHRA
jgi:predicted amidophosphoribosyltransferase